MFRRTTCPKALWSEAAGEVGRLATRADPTMREVWRTRRDRPRSLDKVMERVRTWPEARRRDVVDVLEVMEQSGTAVYMLTDDERAAVQIGLDQANRGEFISDSEMEAFWRRNRA